MAKYRNGKAHEQSIVAEGDYVVINSKFVSTGGVVEKFSSRQLEPLYKNEITFVLSDIPNGKALSKTFLVDVDQKYTLNQRIAAITPKESASFLNELLNRNSYFLKFDNGVGQTNLAKDQVLEFNAFFPSLPEQEAIGTFFSTLDQHITLHQRKLDKLKSVKQAYLSEIFPAEGERVPKRRFPGFTDAWELRKLVEVARFRRGSFPQPYGNSEWYDGDGAMPFVQVADVTDEMNLVGDTKQKISRKAQPLSVFAEEGSVLVTLQGSIGRVAITQYGAFIDRTVLIFEKFNLPVDNLFWAYIIKQKFIEEAKCAPGGTIKTITKEVLSDFDIKLPSHPEQETIGTFFSSLDRHITLHQRKLEKLKNLKKALLNELFV